jgi:hypothetical protein
MSNCELVNREGVVSKSWDELPDIPFYRICNFLDYKHVFGKLSLVCRSFNARLCGDNQIAVERLQVIEPSVQTLQKLFMKISTCKMLYVEALNVNLVTLNANNEVVTKLLSKFSDSLLEFHCKLHPREQDIIIPFVNKCHRLRKLEFELYSSSTSWEWSRQTLPVTIKELGIRRVFIF